MKLWYRSLVVWFVSVCVSVSAHVLSWKMILWWCGVVLVDMMVVVCHDVAIVVVVDDDDDLYFPCCWLNSVEMQSQWLSLESCDRQYYGW